MKLWIGLVVLAIACDSGTNGPDGVAAPDSAVAAPDVFVNDAGGDASGVDAGDASGADAGDGAGTAAAPLRGTLFVVTTRRIVADSARLAPFVEAKRARGYDTVLVTEDQYGADDEVGLPRAIAIRDWLAGALPADGPAYALLIGDSHPLYGDVPMFVVWPRHTYSPTSCLGAFALDCRSFESDMPYADLTGDWDANGNGQWGEHGLDDGPGGLDFEAELYAGRIPVYFDDTSELDVILDHALAYEAQTLAERQYRDRMLLPAAFFYFKGQVMESYTVPATVDGAETPEWFIANVLPDYPEVAVTRMYETEGVVASEYEPDLPLTEAGMLAEWQTGYGMVWWFGHGLERGVYRTFWSEDANGNQLAENGEIPSPFLFNTDDAALLEPGRPAFVVPVSCEVGSAETPLNLAYALLLSGGAIGVVGSTNVTPGDTTDYGDPGSQLDVQQYGATNMGVHFFRALLDGAGGAQALLDTKTKLGQSGSVESYAGRMMINYLGDPTLRLRD